jgi:nucleoside-diphosphate-sugar epimerase
VSGPADSLARRAPRRRAGLPSYLSNDGFPPYRSADMNLAVVTGAPGWLGTSLVEALVRGVSFRAITVAPRRVRCVVLPGVDVAPLVALGSSVEIVRADLRDARALEGVCEGATTVFHAAGIVHPRRVKELYDINVGGTLNILNAAIRSGATRFVFVSSNSPAGLNESAGRLMSEEDPPRPYLNYGLSKLQAEWVVNDSFRAGRIETAIARPCWFYGPQQPARQTKFFRMIKTGRPIVIGLGSNLRSLTYVDNAVQGLLLLESVGKAAGRTYWITDRRPYSFIEILQTVAKILGADLRPRYVPSAGSDVARFVDSLLQMAGLYQQEIHVAGELTASIAVSIEAAQRDLGYAPEIELEEGMRRSIDWCRAHGIEL